MAKKSNICREMYRKKDFGVQDIDILVFSISPWVSEIVM